MHNACIMYFQWESDFDGHDKDQIVNDISNDVVHLHITGSVYTRQRIFAEIQVLVKILQLFFLKIIFSTLILCFLKSFLPNEEFLLTIFHSLWFYLKLGIVLFVPHIKIHICKQVHTKYCTLFIYDVDYHVLNINWIVLYLARLF